MCFDIHPHRPIDTGDTRDGLGQRSGQYVIDADRFLGRGPKQARRGCFGHRRDRMNDIADEVSRRVEVPRGQARLGCCCRVDRLPERCLAPKSSRTCGGPKADGPCAEGSSGTEQIRLPTRSQRRPGRLEIRHQNVPGHGVDRQMVDHNE